MANSKKTKQLKILTMKTLTMKTLTKLFLAVAVGMFALACVTDATNDLGVKHNSGHTTEITLSLEASRTQLGEAVDGIYPLYWSEGDQISANGVASNALAAHQAGSAVAGFVVNGELTAPYCIAYPVAPAGKVVFAEKQNLIYSEGANSTVATTMYGYSAEGVGVELKHLTGVLKIGIQGEGEIKEVHISTPNRTPIAGEFNLDFESGAITPTENSKGVIVGNLFSETDGGGLQLKNEPQYIYVSVPAGVYDEMYVTLIDVNNSAMFAVVKASESKPLTAGNVRNFTKAINYTPADFTIIHDVASLKAFGENQGAKDVLFVADIDMTGEEWTAINNTYETDAASYEGTIYGNGYSIKGLTAPLFMQTKASFKGLHLVDVDIKSDLRMLGALACFINSSTAVVENCSVTGKIYQNGDYSTVTSYATFGGLIGNHYGKGVSSNLYSKVDLEVAGSFNGTVRIGGVVGDSRGTLKDVVNHGTMKFSGTTFNSTAMIAGVCAISVTMENCVNGSPNDKTLGKIIGCGTSGKSYTFGGISDTTTNMTNCHNYGDMVYEATCNNFYGGGVTRTFSAADTVVKDCSNYGDFIYKGTSAQLYHGGLSNRNDKAVTIENCHNFGKMEFTEESVSTVVRVGGVFGIWEIRNTSYVRDCSNSGDIIFKGSASSTVQLGGLVGHFQAQSSSTATWSSEVVNYTNNGNITLGGTLSGKTIRMGGIFATFGSSLASSSKGDIVNHGNLTFEGEMTNDEANLAIGGYLGASSRDVAANYIKPINTGNIKCVVTPKASQVVNIGGAAGTMGSKYIGNTQVFCDIEAVGLTNVGMVIGAARNLDDGNARTCKLGGRIALTNGEDGKPLFKALSETVVGESKENSEGDMEFIADPNYTVWYDHIYGGITAWAEGSTYDSCSFLDSKENITYSK